MKDILLSLLIVLIGLQVKSQHCPFDFAHIIVVNVHSINDTSVISNLRITLLDSSEQTVVTQKWELGKWVDDTLKFWQNPDSTSHSGKIDNNNPMNPWTIRFWFARKNYVLVTGGRLPGKKIRIEDVDGKENGAYFETEVVDLTKNDLYPLCTGFSHWDLGEKYGFVKNYKPLQVTLTKK